MNLKLYYYDQCGFCQRVLRKISQLELNNKIELCNVLENDEHAKYHRAATGRNTVPCLYIDNVPMFESSDINRWLENNVSEIKK